MCGIAGIVSLGINNDSGNRRLVQSAISAQSHRGPDSQGFFQNSNVCLGMCRLSIIDIKNGQQPNFNSDRKIVSIFNGEIYNFKELRKLDLPFSSQLQSYGDSALIPYMFERFGPEFVHQLRGQFAIAIADLRAGEFFLYRDRFGEKPLWYQKNDSEVKFASEMRGLLALDIEREIEDNSVCEFLQYGYVNAPRSIFKNVFQVRPAHFLRFSKDEVSEHSYWRPTSVVSRETSFTLAKQEAKQLIMESVELQMVAERDVGIFLSGGIDSSLIASYARKISPKIKTFSIGFFNDEFDESRYSSRVAQSLKTSHFEKKIIADPVLILRDISELIDHPFADSSIIPTYLFA